MFLHGLRNNTVLTPKKFRTSYGWHLRGPHAERKRMCMEISWHSMYYSSISQERVRDTIESWSFETWTDRSLQSCLSDRAWERERERELGIGIRAGEKKSLGMGDSLLWKGGGGRKHNLLLEGSQVTPVVLKPEFRYLIFKVAVYTPQKTKLRLHYKHSLANAVWKNVLFYSANDISHINSPCRWICLDFNSKVDSILSNKCALKGHILLYFSVAPNTKIVAGSIGLVPISERGYTARERTLSLEALLTSAVTRVQSFLQEKVF